MHANEVVSVHDSVDESIENNGEVYITIVLRVGIEPVEEENGEVMVNMQEGQLSPFLSKYDEDGIPEVPDLGCVEQPKKVSKRRLVTAVVVAANAVSVAVSDHTSFDGHVSTEHDLRNVVEELDGVWVDWIQILHNFGSEEYECKVSKCDGDCGMEISEQPSLGVSSEILLRVDSINDAVADRVHELDVHVHFRSVDCCYFNIVCLYVFWNGSSLIPILQKR